MPETKKTRRKGSTGMKMTMEVRPLNAAQRRVMEEYEAGQNLLLLGAAGTGKTLLGMYLALSDVEDKRARTVHVVRSIVSSRDPGFMPGDLHDKTRVFESPYHSIAQELYGRGDAYDVLKGTGELSFTTTSFIRGVTFRDCVLVVDEIQNMLTRELDTIMTRVGEGCRVVACGDSTQSDLDGRDRRGIFDFTRIAERMPSFSTIRFSNRDVVRSDLVREYLTARDDLGVET